MWDVVHVRVAVGEPVASKLDVTVPVGDSVCSAVAVWVPESDPLPVLEAEAVAEAEGDMARHPHGVLANFTVNTLFR